MRKAHELALGTAAKVLFDGGGQHAVSFGVVKRLTGFVDGRKTAFRNQKTHRPLHGIELGSDELTHQTVLFDAGAHQGHAGVVAVEQAPLEALRHSVPAAEVDHVERAATADVRHGVPRKDIQARRASAQHALADLVGHFGGGDVNHTS